MRGAWVGAAMVLLCPCLRRPLLGQELAEHGDVDLSGPDPSAGDLADQPLNTPPLEGHVTGPDPLQSDDVGRDSERAVEGFAATFGELLTVEVLHHGDATLEDVWRIGRLPASEHAVRDVQVQYVLLLQRLPSFLQVALDERIELLAAVKLVLEQLKALGCRRK